MEEMVWVALPFGLIGFSLAAYAFVKCDELEKRLQQLEDRLNERHDRADPGEADEEKTD